MKKIIFLSIGLISFCFGQAIAQQQNTPSATYGEAFEESYLLSPERLPSIMKSEKTLKNVVLIGYVSEVCQKEGCWLKMTTKKNGNDDVFVKMKDHAFLVPKDLAGKKVRIHGVLKEESQSVAEQKHYLKDAGASKNDINAITQPKVSYVLIATGVKVY